MDPVALLTGNVTQIAYLIKQGYFGFETKQNKKFKKNTEKQNSTLVTSEWMNHVPPAPSLSFPGDSPQRGT